MSAALRSRRLFAQLLCHISHTFSDPVNLCAEITPESELTWELGAGHGLLSTRGRCRLLQPPISSLFSNLLPEITKSSVFHQRLCRNVMRQKRLMDPKGHSGTTNKSVKDQRAKTCLFNRNTEQRSKHVTLPRPLPQDNVGQQSEHPACYPTPKPKPHGKIQLRGQSSCDL